MENMKNKEENENMKLSILLIILIFVLIFLMKDIIFPKQNMDDPQTISLKIGETYLLNNNGQELSWSSSDDSIASVDKQGKVTCSKEGIVTITAYDNDNKKHEYIIEIEGNNNKTSLTLQKREITLKINSTYKLNVDVEPKDYDIEKLSWSSSNNDVVTVQNGTIKALKVGSSIITVTNENGQSSTCKVIVEDNQQPEDSQSSSPTTSPDVDDIPPSSPTTSTEVESISFHEKSTKIYIGDSYQTKMIVKPSNVEAKISYKSKNTKIATVSNNGKITAISEGKTEITATYKNFTDTFSITVMKKNSIKTLTISFNNNGSDKISSSKETCTIKSSDGCQITFPTIMREGYQILGWSRDKNAKAAEYRPGETKTFYGNETYYAITSKTLTATFDAGKTTISKDKASCTVYNLSNSCTVETPTITKTNYTSVGWGSSKDSSNVIAYPKSNLQITKNATYYPITKIAVDGIEAGCTGWMAITGYYYSNAKTSSTKTKITVGTPFTIEGVDGSFFKVSIPNVSGYKYIQHKYVMINLSDYIPSMVFEITNATSSIFKSSGYNIDGVTGTKLYQVGKVYNPRLGKKEYMAPILYTVAKKLLVAQKNFQSQGYSIKVYDTYRPHSVSKKVYALFSDLYDSNAVVKENVQYSYGVSGKRYKWSKTWFISSGVSSHNTGSAIDMTLVNKNTKVEVTMPTVMHELSTKAIKYYSSDAAKKPANYAKEMNDIAKLMDKVVTDTGLSSLASEWWHFLDKDANSLIKSKESKGCDFSVTKVYSY